MCQGDKNEDPDSRRVLLGHAWGGRRLVWFEENFDLLHLGWTRALKRLATVIEITLDSATLFIEMLKSLRMDVLCAAAGKNRLLWLPQFAMSPS